MTVILFKNICFSTYECAHLSYELIQYLENSINMFQNLKLIRKRVSHSDRLCALKMKRVFLENLLSESEDMEF